MKCGILLLDKESGCSSARALAALKRRLGVKKIGHAGTLDPLASGLLVCLVGSATRLASFAAAGRKIYSGTIMLGLTTSSDDVDGEILSRSDVIPEFSRIQQAASQFVGEIEQVPPAVSAVKVNGERAYKLARRGEKVELKPRAARVESFELSAVAPNCVAFKVTCSSGTYVRSLARDLGRRLGCGGCIGALRREASYPFEAEQARQLADLGTEHLLSVEQLFPTAQRLHLDRISAGRLHRGDERALQQLCGTLQSGTHSSNHALYLNRENGEILGLLVRQGNSWNFGVNIGT